MSGAAGPGWESVFGGADDANHLASSVIEWEGYFTRKGWK